MRVLMEEVFQRATEIKAILEVMNRNESSGLRYDFYSAFSTPILAIQAVLTYYLI